MYNPHNKGKKSTHCGCGLPRTPENTNAQGYCKVCSAAAQERYKKAHPDANRGKHYLRKYGVSKEQVEDRLKAQEYKCAICKMQFDWSSKDTAPNVDHVHDETRAFRGVLCHRCNTGLGLFLESQELLQAAIKYLEEHETSFPFGYGAGV